MYTFKRHDEEKARRPFPVRDSVWLQMLSWMALSFRFSVLPISVKRSLILTIPSIFAPFAVKAARLSSSPEALQEIVNSRMP